MNDLSSGALSSGKGHRDENFPVASALLKREHRAPILAFYRFARAADDVADHPTAPREEKLARLAAMRAGLSVNGAERFAGENPDLPPVAPAKAGVPLLAAQKNSGVPAFAGTTREGSVPNRTNATSRGAPVAVAFARVARARGLSLVHAHELLDAFTQDVTVRRYASWDELIGYCRLSAMPVGRYVLDVHREDPATWPLSDALCAALQVINHLQDCGRDYRALDRVYLPLDLLAAAGADVAMLGADHATPALRAAIVAAAERARGLLGQSAGFAAAIRDARLAAEVAVIHALADDLCALLLRRDPLRERVHHGKLRAGGLALAALLRQGLARVFA